MDLMKQNEKKNMEYEKKNKPYELSDKQKRYLPWKRVMDVVIAGAASIVLAPVMGALALAIKLDSPGPVLFKQQRVGKEKELFEIWKFRTMRIDTPKDVPTHMLNNPEQFITKTGVIMRKFSLDELPQLWQCVNGSLSLIGPRPALYNQDDLVAERDKYGANSITPGITGWAQINGRDELEIDVKARFDGEYVEKLGLWMDIKCFLGTIGSVLSHEGVVEGGTGEAHRNGVKSEGTVSRERVKKDIRMGAVVCGITGVVGAEALTQVWRLLHREKRALRRSKNNYFKYIGIAVFSGVIATIYTNIKRKIRMQDQFVDEEAFPADTKQTADVKKILITGAGSYIGMSVDAWLNRTEGAYQTDTLDMLAHDWRETDFSQYDVVYHVAGIAHADVGDATEEQKQLYYKVNTDLAVEVAEIAKASGVKQFIFMSSMIIYSGCKESFINRDTEPKPLNFYGDSKWQADRKISGMSSDLFKVVILRPPMIYGKGSKGNYPELAKLAAKLPVFPIVKNQRSMLHIDNLCQFVKLMIDNEESGIFFPQNAEYTNTSDMVQMIAAVKGHRIIMIPFTNLAVKFMRKFPGKVGALAAKAFGDLAYDMKMSDYKENYRVNSLMKSIELTEGDH